MIFKPIARRELERYGTTTSNKKKVSLILVNREKCALKRDYKTTGKKTLVVVCWKRDTKKRLRKKIH
jgi:hypothetical protein